MLAKVRVATIINMIVNVALVFLNLFIGLMFSSMSLISKGLESIYDVITAVIIHFTVKINGKQADDCHQFGHSRAESIAGYTIGVLMLIFGLKIAEVSFRKILNPEIIEFNNLLFVAVLVTLFVKLGLYFYMKNILKKYNSPALKANMQDHLNDILLLIGVFIAVIAIKYEYYIIDPIVGLLISFLIIKSGVVISLENMKYLMGASADKHTLDKIEKIALEISEVKIIKQIKSQYLGNKLQIEIHIGIDENFNIKKGHEIGNEVRDKILRHHNIASCFVHIDPVVVE